MSKKKHTLPTVSEEESTQVQHLLGQFHQIAGALHSSFGQADAQAALNDINSMSEAAQIALLKALSKENHTDAADILISINELSPIKNVRKEARRSLIQLESAKIYPAWNPPVERVPLIQIDTAPLDFWKGMVTGNREAGKIQLMLLWHQGFDQVRLLGFLLDFWGAGVKDFFTQVGSKRSIEVRLEALNSRGFGLETTSCTLAEGRRLLLEALDVNQQFGTSPHADYLRHLSTVKQLVLDIPDLEPDLEEDEDEALSNLEPAFFEDFYPPEDVLYEFIEAWSDADYEFAYDLLASNSDLREGLSQDEWVERRSAWAEKAHPSDLDIAFNREHGPGQTEFVLPSAFVGDQESDRQVVDVGWSLELTDTLLGEALKELPRAGAVYKETGRHWFWTSYTLVKEHNEDDDEDEWRILGMTDEAASALSLPLEELQNRVERLDTKLKELVRERKLDEVDFSELEVIDLLAEPLEVGTELLHYDDALIAHQPGNHSAYELAVIHAMAIEAFERAAVYFELIAERFPDQRAQALQKLAITQLAIAEGYYNKDDDERGDRFYELTSSSLWSSLAVEDDPFTRLMLANILYDNDHLDEAEEHLHRAAALSTEDGQKAIIESAFGDIAMRREQYDQALHHFQRVVETDPTDSEAWLNIGVAQHRLGNSADAEANLQRAMELDPNDYRIYTSLGRIYVENKAWSKAREILEQGLRVNPNSAELRVYLSLVLLEKGDYRRAEKLLKEAEAINPELEITPLVRQALKQLKHKKKKR